ncbi:hypothetical protein MYAM1_003995 [Malassezia yamatoensis]|uniref:Carboxylic ester hydrolase n=1 Tax=Malassezia yamatoensis TaxID=253288 RepID=A0AAJ6CIB7_9BASI|nr:hypothetical protein MYAM1_003995 [Malassezia yamatoensis]
MAHCSVVTKALVAFVVLAGVFANLQTVAARDVHMLHHQHLAQSASAAQTYHQKAESVSSHKAAFSSALQKQESSDSKAHYATPTGTASRSHSKNSSVSSGASKTSTKSRSGSSTASATGTSSSNSSGSDFLVVDTREGEVRGTYNKTSGTYSWLGVPFGSDTSGSNRYMAPEPAGKRKGVFDATQYGFSCPQHFSSESRLAAGLFGLPSDTFDGSIQSEDCLNVNIQVGKNFYKKFMESNGTHKAPVWLNFYGGSYEWGSNRIALYKADNIVNQDDIVVVSANYRNWIFGYPLAPQLHPAKNRHNSNYTGGNPGLKDLDLAIEWVHKNIANFGGDPDRITIGGTSTGACSVDNWSFVHYNKPSAKLVKGIILQSGSMTSLGRYFLAANDATFTESDSQWNLVANEVGCGISNDRAQFRCMQKKSWRTLMQASIDVNAKFTLAIDNVTTFNNYFDRLEQRRFTPTPMLIGNNKDEGNAFLIHEASLTTFVGPIITSEAWVCPAAVQADLRHGYAPTWRYRFSPSFYIPETPVKYRELLTYHGGDTAYAWNTWEPFRYDATEDSSSDPYPLVTYPVPTDKNSIRRPIADVYREANVQFVKDPVKGLYDFHGGWPQYRKGQKTVGDIGFNNDVSRPFRLAPNADIDGLCPLTNAQVNMNNMKYKPGFSRVRSYLA